MTDMFEDDLLLFHVNHDLLITQSKQEESILKEGNRGFKAVGFLFIQH